MKDGHRESGLRAQPSEFRLHSAFSLYEFSVSLVKRREWLTALVKKNETERNGSRGGDGCPHGRRPW